MKNKKVRKKYLFIDTLSSILLLLINKKKDFILNWGLVNNTNTKTKT